MFFSFMHPTHLPTTFLLYIYNAQSMQRLRTCVKSIPVSPGSPVDAFILSRLKQISGNRGQDLCKPGQINAVQSAVNRASSLHINRP